MIHRIGLMFSILLGLILNVSAQTKILYSFMVAGHAYGAHAGGNLGLHPNFLNALNAGYDSTVQFIILTGDIVNNSTKESWDQVEVELNAYALPSYYVLGNHDANAIGITVFEEKYGSTYYSFDYQGDRFIILNSIKADRAISETQLNFLSNQLGSKGDSINNVFVFFHEVIWNSLDKYKGVLSNSRSRYDQMVDHSNYWQEVHPLFVKYPNTKITVIAGDVGGNPDAVAAFYDTWDNVTLLASGMGEVANENYLQVNVNNDASVGFELIPLNDGVIMHDVEFYSVPQKPEFIVGESIISSNDASFHYTVSEVENADSYLWELPENSSGSSTSSSIDVTFNSDFVSGTISVKAASKSFGNSNSVSYSVSSSISSIGSDVNNKFEVDLIRNNGLYILRLSKQSAYEVQIEIYDLMGRKYYSSSLHNSSTTEFLIELPKLLPNIYVLRVFGENIYQVKKILIK